MQPGRQKRRVAPSDAGIQQHDPPSLPPPDQAAPDQWDKYWLQTANSTENAYHNQPPQTGYHATQQLYVDPFFNHGNTTAMRPVGPLGFDRNTFVGGSSQSSAAVTQQALFSSNQAIPHSSYHIHDATVYGSLAQLTSSNGSFLDDGIFNSDQTVQNSFQGDRQFPAFVDTSQPGHVVAPPRYSLRDPNQGMRQVSRDNSKTYDNPNIPPAQHGNLAAPLAPGPIFQAIRQGKFDCPMAAYERLHQPLPGAPLQARLSCMEAKFLGHENFSHVKEHCRGTHGVEHPECGCFLKDRRDIITDHLRNGLSNCRVDSHAKRRPYAIVSALAIDQLTKKAPVAPAARPKSPEWYRHQEGCWKDLFVAIYTGHNFEPFDIITPCKPKTIQIIPMAY